MSSYSIELPSLTPYIFTPTLNIEISRADIEQMGQLAGRFYKNYRLTPKQAVFITSIAITALSLLISYFVSPLAILGLGFSGFGFYYRFKDQDIQSQAGHKKMSEAFAKLQALELIENPKKFTHLIDYDLSSFSKREDRLRDYVLLKRLEDLFIQIIKLKIDFQLKIEQSKRTLENEFEAKSLHTKHRAEYVEAMARSMKALEKTQKEIDDKKRRITALKTQITQIKEAYIRQHTLACESKSLSSKVQKALNQRLLLLPAFEKEYATLFKELFDPERMLKQQQELLEHHRRELAIFDETYQQRLQPIQKWETDEQQALEQAMQEKLASIQKGFNEALSGLSID